MKKFLQVTCLAIAGSAASFAAFADPAQSQNAPDALPALCSKCEASNPPVCDGKQVIMRDSKISEICLDGYWAPSSGHGHGQWACDENGKAFFTATKYPGNVVVSGGGFGCASEGKPMYSIGFIGIHKSGNRKTAAAPIRFENRFG